MKRMLSLLLALALCGALVGCGGQDSSSSSGGPVSSAPGIYMPRMLMVDGVLYEDKMGTSAWIYKKKILVGNRDLLINHDIAVPKQAYEAVSYTHLTLPTKA